MGNKIVVFRHDADITDFNRSVDARLRRVLARGRRLVQRMTRDGSIPAPGNADGRPILIQTEAARIAPGKG